ncbi:MAG TPA: sensor histidine kinase N-terminal domain-containing protein [Ferrovibrio sp.]
MKIESLRIYLLCWLLLPLACIAGLNVWSTHQSSRRIADTVTDRTLIASARSIAEQASMAQGVIDISVPPAALEMFNTGHGDSVYYRVESRQGRLLAGYPDLPLPPLPAAAAHPAFYSGAYRDRPLRLVAMTQPVVGAGAASPILVVVGATLNSHDEMLQELWIGAVGQQLTLLLGAALLVVIGLNRGLAPLLRLRNAVLKRGRDDLAPFAVNAVQRELRPLVEALNLYMQRVQQQMAAQRRFVSNAAHQLKTPLTLLNTQATFALRAADEVERQDSLRALLSNTRQTARLANQLLTLARAEPGSRRPRHDVIDLQAAARQVLEQYADAAIEKQLDLSLTETKEPVRVRGDGTMIREMLVNLIDNALRYTPPGGAVAVSVERRDQICILRIGDTGPGIPPAERERVFERFYRLPEAAGEGSGLGLAIVREICMTAGGAVRLLDPPGGRGTLVEVTLPAAAA